MSDDIAIRKQQLRDRMLELRARMPERDRKKAAHRIADQFIGNVPRRSWDIIGGYWPISGEVDTVLLMEALAEQGHTIALPCVAASDTPLTFRRWQKGMELVKNTRYKTLEPPAGNLEVIPTLLIVPLLAFDAAGYRLGFGGGFYDRTLAALKDTQSIFTVGLAFAKQQAGVIPHETHDVPLDCIITEERVLLAAAE